MLCLSRREGETIIIAGNIRVVINRIDHKTVRIGIDAPKEVPIVRGELLEHKETEPKEEVGK